MPRFNLIAAPKRITLARGYVYLVAKRRVVRVTGLR